MQTQSKTPRSKGYIRSFFIETEEELLASNTVTPLVEKLISVSISVLTESSYKDALEFRTHEDLVHDCIFKFLKYGLIEKYDPSRTTFYNYVFKAVRNSLSSICKKENKYRRHLSLESPIGGSDNEDCTLLDIIPSNISNPESSMITREFLLKLKSNFYGTGLYGNSPFFGRIELSHFYVVVHLMLSYPIEEISNMFNVNKNRISSMLNAVRAYYISSTLIS